MSYLYCYIVECSRVRCYYGNVVFSYNQQVKISTWYKNQNNSPEAKKTNHINSKIDSLDNRAESLDTWKNFWTVGQTVSVANHSLESQVDGFTVSRIHGYLYCNVDSSEPDK